VDNLFWRSARDRVLSDDRRNPFSAPHIGPVLSGSDNEVWLWGRSVRPSFLVYAHIHLQNRASDAIFSQPA